MNDYREFLAGKKIATGSIGPYVEVSDVNPVLFDFQRYLVKWAVRKGRCALFCDTGLGKTFMQLEFCRLLGGRALIVAPLSVARQTVREAEKLGLHVYYTRGGLDVTPGINITNYEMLEHFNPEDFDIIVLDESSILKSLNSKTRAKLIDMFSETEYRLCCTATPAPNDIAEIANHSEFLGIMTRVDMLATFFVHDDEGWRLKKHAEQPFYRWLASWGMSVKTPSDLGFSDEGYILPELNIQPLWVKTDYVPEGQLFFTGLKGITDRTKVRHATLEDRVRETAELVNNNSEQWLIWCGLNDESNAITKAIPGAIEVKGNDSLESKIANIQAFQDGEHRVMVTKSKIAGFGMNFQNAHNMAFLGLNDSWESYYQCIRREYRFGQKHPVNVWIVLSEIEDEIYHNIKSKEAEAEKMSRNLIAHIKEFEREEIMDHVGEKFEYQTGEAEGNGWKLMLGDSCERLAEVQNESVHLSVFSPPFQSLYVYSPTERDLGNSHDSEEFSEHFGYIIDHLFRVTVPGRLCCVHVADLGATLNNDGYIGLKDFPGLTIREFTKRGWIFHGRVTIDKDPQAQAIRTHSKALLFVQKNKDSSWSRPAIADDIVIFRKPGENPVPIVPDITNEEWIEWARPIWYNIKETDTLNFRAARENADERHICPLQLGTIERCVRLWSNPGETILSPFAGIGSELYEAVRLNRKAIGCELKPSYFRQAVKNLREAENRRNEIGLFEWAAQQQAEQGQPA